MSEVQSTQVAPVAKFRSGWMVDISFASGERYCFVANNGESLGDGPSKVKNTVKWKEEERVRKALYRLGDFLRTHEGRCPDKIAKRAAQIAANTASMREFQQALEKLVAKTEEFAMTAEI
jgi:hypothetical protein